MSLRAGIPSSKRHGDGQGFPIVFSVLRREAPEAVESPVAKARDILRCGAKCCGWRFVLRIFIWNSAMRWILHIECIWKSDRPGTFGDMNAAWDADVHWFQDMKIPRLSIVYHGLHGPCRTQAGTELDMLLLWSLSKFQNLSGWTYKRFEGMPFLSFLYPFCVVKRHWPVSCLMASSCRCRIPWTRSSAKCRSQTWPVSHRLRNPWGPWSPNRPMSYVMPSITA